MKVNDLAGFVREFDLLRQRAALGTRKVKVGLDDLARRVGMPRSTVHSYVTGKALAPADVLDKLVIVLGASGTEQHEWAEAWFRMSTSMAPTRPAAAAVVPAQLPAGARGFAGRIEQLWQLDALLTEQVGTVVVSAIDGMAGVGKTALAVHWAHQVRHQFPDGQLFVNLRGFDPGGQVVDPEEAVRRFLDALDVPAQRIPAGLDAKTALFRSVITGRRMLILLDNARDSAQVRPLLPGAPGCLVIVTSRNHLAGLIAADGAHPITLDVMPPGEIRQMLARRIGADRTSAEPPAVEEIITRCAGLPLALAIVAARAAARPHHPLTTLAGELRHAHDRLSALTGDDPHTDMRAVLSWSYQTQSPAAARLFRLLGLHPGPDITAPAAASLAAFAAPEVEPLLAELTRANLLAEHVAGRYTLHDLLRAYAEELAHATDNDQQRHAATHRMLDHYLHTAYAADRQLYPFRDVIDLTPPQPGATPEPFASHESAMAWFTAERPVLLGVINLAAAAGFDIHTWQLAWAMWTFLHRQGHWHDQTTAQRAALAAARRLADPTAQAAAHRHLASADTWLGRFDEAHRHLHCSLDLHQQTGDLSGQARSHRSFARFWEQQGLHAEALEHDRRSLDLYRTAGDQIGQATILTAIGWDHALIGDHQQALTYCEEALTLHQQLDDHYGQAAAWGSLGYARHHLGHYPEAITCYRHALDLYRNLGDRYQEAKILTRLGDTHHITGDPHSAQQAWHQALTILTDLNHADASRIHTKLAQLG